ncbi:hypothetical protein [Leisingera caerulea]|uniref:hypothetical protein n=1 Tax=Leisingera caerulea TaxID=506591 RepID=UPI0003FA4BD8|nr:hypothetical protein [Leisingera caerulea]
MDGAFSKELPVFSQNEIKDLKQSGGKFVKHHMGGGGGSRFDHVSLRELRLESGELIEAIILNGERHGGKGKDKSNSVTLSPDVLVQDIGYSVSDGFLSGLRFHFTDGTTLQGGVLNDEKLLSAELGCSQQELLVIALGGSSGKFLDSLDAVCVVGYSRSTVLARDVTAIVGAITPGMELSEYTEVASRKTESYERALSQTHSVTTSASVSGTYYVTASVETEYAYKWSDDRTIGRDFEEVLASKATQNISVPEHAWAYLKVTRGDIISPDGSPDKSVFIPSGNNAINYRLADEHSYTNLAGHYDLNGYCANLPADRVSTRLDATTGLMIVECS